MYIPRHHAVSDEMAVRALVASTARASFVTTGEDGYPEATLLPIVWTGDRVVAHLAKANKHWQHLADGAPCLLVVEGVDAYVSPSWYPSKQEHGRVVPTWNYETVHLRGRAHLHHDQAWLEAAVTALTVAQESHRAAPWHVTDAPSPFIAGQLRGIVGIEVTIEAVDAKSKLSQNRSDADRAGVIAGLRATGTTRDTAVADTMAVSEIRE